MSANLAEQPATICDWCGKENAQRLANCTSCGTRLVAEAEPAPEAEDSPKPKSRLLAVCLSLFFGPLGLIYVNAWGTAFLMLAIALPLLFTHAGGLWVTFGFRILCAFLAFSLVKENAVEPDSTRDSERLLVAAARLENVNREEAILAYEDIIRLYPNTRASNEAARNIETLKRAG